MTESHVQLNNELISDPIHAMHFANRFTKRMVTLTDFANSATLLALGHPVSATDSSPLDPSHSLTHLSVPNAFANTRDASRR